VIPSGALLPPPPERRRVKTAGHPYRNTLIRRLHGLGWSIRRIARRFLLSPTRTWEICAGQGAWLEHRSASPLTPGKSLPLPSAPAGAGGTVGSPPNKGACTSPSA